MGVDGGGGGGGGHGFGEGGGGHASIGHGHAFSGFTGRGFSPGFSGMRVFSTGRFSGRGDDGRFRDRDFGIATLGSMGVSEIGTNGIIAISSTILISLRSVFLIGGTLTTDTPTTNIPTRMRMTIPHRLTVTSIGKIWR